MPTRKGSERRAILVGFVLFMLSSTFLRRCMMLTSSASWFLRRAHSMILAQYSFRSLLTVSIDSSKTSASIVLRMSLWLVGLSFRLARDSFPDFLGFRSGTVDRPSNTRFDGIAKDL